MTFPTPDPHQPLPQPAYASGPVFAPGPVTPPGTLPPASVPGGQRPPVGGLSIATFVVSFFAGLVAVVLGVFALRQNWVRGTRGTGLAWAGIIIGAVLGVAQTWIFMLLFWVASNAVV